MILYTIIFTFWLISPIDEQFEGVLKAEMPQAYCEVMAQTLAAKTLPLNVKRAEFRCASVVNIGNFRQVMPKNKSEGKT